MAMEEGEAEEGGALAELGLEMVGKQPIITRLDLVRRGEVMVV